MDVKTVVKERYGETARTGSGCCGTPEVSQAVGYSSEQLAAVPKTADLGLGCGNPTALAEIRPGETVLDLGSGAGLDCFLAARDVGPAGRVIGVDMTPDMLARARANAAKVGYTNVEFREGEIERLPVEDNSVDLVMSNCVINLSPDKPQVFREIHRVLKPGGRMVVSDIVLNGKLPRVLQKSAAAYAACIAGAAQKEDYLRFIEQAGLREVTVVKETGPPEIAHSTDPFMRLAARFLRLRDGRSRIASITVRAMK